MSLDNFNMLPYVSRELEISTELPPFDYCPAVQIRYYEPTDTVFLSNFASWAAVGERVRFTAVLNRAAYNAALLSAGYLGDFDTNFQSFTACVSYQHPMGLPQCNEQVQGLWFNPSSTEVAFNAEIRVPENWAGQIYYISLVLGFKHNGQDDYIVVVFGISVAPENLEAVTLDQPFTTYGFYKNGKLIETLCIDETPGVIELRVDHTKEGYYSLAVLQKDGVFSSEFDGFDGGDLPKLVDDPFLSHTSEAISGGQREIYRLDESLLAGDECIFVAIKRGEAEDEPEPCDPDYEVEVEIQSVQSPSGLFFPVVDWNINPSLGADLVEIRLTLSAGAFVQTRVSTNNAGQVYFDIIPHPSVMTLQVEVVRADGCVNIEDFTFTLNSGQTVEHNYFE